MKENERSTKEKRVFADENTKKGWELHQRVKELCSKYPDENLQRVISIGFDQEYTVDGFEVITAVDKVAETQQGGIYRVPGRTLKILDELGIPYQIH